MRKIIIIALTIVFVAVAGILVMNKEVGNSEEDTVITVGVIFNGSIDDKSWTQAHYEGLLETVGELNLQLSYRQNVSDENAAACIDELIAEGCEIVVATSFGFGEAIQAAAKAHPEISFFHATGVVDGNNLTTYFGRIYQMRYLCGIVAGLQTDTNEIGYAAAFPFSEVNRGINAFTLGVRTVNPEAKVYVEWCNSWEDDSAVTEATQRLIDNHNIDVITVHSDSIAYMELCDKKGIDIIGYNIDHSADFPDTYLTAAVWDWEKFYTPRFTEWLQDRFVGKNHWEGVESGIISLAPLSENVKDGTQAVIDERLELIMSGKFDVFYGPVYDNTGTLRIAEGENMSDESLLNEFDWYVEGVVICEE